MTLLYSLSLFLSFLLCFPFAVVAHGKDGHRHQHGSEHGHHVAAEKRQSSGTWWREAVAHNGRSTYLHPEDADLLAIYRDVRNKTFEGGVVGDGVTDDSKAIQAAISYGTEELLYYRQDIAAQSQVPAWIFVPGGTYLINSSLQLPTYTMLIGDPLDPPTFISSSTLGTDAIIYVYDAGFGRQPTTQFFHAVRNIIFDTSNVPANISGNAINLPGSQATSIINCHFKMPVGSQHLGIQMYGPNDVGGSGTIISDLKFYGGATGIRFNNQQYSFKNMTFDSVQTAILVVHGFTALFQGMDFRNCGLGVNLASSDASISVTLLDSTCSHTTNVMQIGEAKTGKNAIVIDNFVSSNCGATVFDNGTNAVVLAGSISDTWVLGPIIDSSRGVSIGTNSSNEIGISTSLHSPFSNATISGSHNGSTNGSTNANSSTGHHLHVKRPASLVDENGKYFTMIQPQYEGYDISQISNVKTEFFARGDGTTDDTAAIQAAFTANAGKKITFLPQGTYIISAMVVVPPGTIVVGEVWSVFQAAGSWFEDAENPRVMLQIGRPGDVGVAQFSDVLFSVNDVLPGAILVEVNMAGTKKGDVAFWNSHFRIGGWVGSRGIRQKCQKKENVWGWTADHDIDGGPSTYIATGRGVLVEGTQATWFTGTAFEHNTLYQYQLEKAENVFIGLQQTETPYWQGPPNPNAAPAPWVPDARYNDPTFSNCDGGSDTHGEQCNMAWGVRIVGGENIYIYNSGLWVFFNDLNPLSNGMGQYACGQVAGGTEHLYWFDLDTLNCDYMAFDDYRTNTTQANNLGSWNGAVGAYLA